MLNKIKLILGLTDDSKNDLIELLIDMVEDEIREVTKAVNFSDNLVINMVVIRYQRRGTECLSTASYNGTTENYTNIYPAYIQNQLKELKNSNRRLRTL